MQITSQQIMDPSSFPIFSKVALIIAGVFAITIIGIPVAILIVASSVCFNLIQSSKGVEQVKERAEVAFRKYIGKPVKYIDINVAGLGNRKATGTGIAYDNQTVYILDRGVAATIPLAAVRQWKWRIDGHETVTLYGDFNQKATFIADINNANAKHEAYKNSGLFVDVEYINQPEWHFMTDDKNTLVRWMEILRQASEGKI